MQKKSGNILTFTSPVVGQKHPTKNEVSIKFTDVTIKSLESLDKRKIYWCKGLTGFGIRVSPQGNKSWVYDYRLEGHHRLLTLGKYPRMTLREARKAFAIASEKVIRGIDPATEHLTAKENERRAMTVKELAPMYVAYCEKLGQKRVYDKRRALNKEILPHIGNKKVKDVSFRDIAKIMNDIFMDREATTLPARLLSYCRTMFRFAKNNLGLIEVNPCMDLQPPVRSGKKTRALDTKEIYQFWYNLEKTNMSLGVQLGIKFMFCTLCRGIEARNMKWSEVDLEERIWVIPGHKAKNGKDHLVPLNRHALALIEEMRPYSENSEYVFGWNPVLQLGKGQKPKELRTMCKDAFSHSLRLNFHHLALDEKFTPHDLRRSAASILTTIGYSKDWVGRLLNHTITDITGSVYDTYDYYEEKRAGTELISYVLDRVLSTKDKSLVPTRKTLRREVMTKGLVFKFMNEDYYSETAESLMDHQATSSSLVSYTLSYGLEGLS